MIRYHNRYVTIKAISFFCYEKRYENDTQTMVTNDIKTMPLRYIIFLPGYSLNSVDDVICVAIHICTPVLTAPVLTAPVLTAPVLTAPVLTAPVLTAPVLTAPVLTTPVLTAPALTTPVLTAPVLTAPALTALFSLNWANLYMLSILSKDNFDN